MNDRVSSTILADADPQVEEIDPADLDPDERYRLLEGDIYWRGEPSAEQIDGQTYIDGMLRVLVWVLVAAALTLTAYLV